MSCRHTLFVNDEKMREVTDHLDRRAEGHLERGTSQPSDPRDRSAAVGFIALVFVPLLLVHLIANVLVWIGVSHP
jgi:hypothetical protein